jgi:hypothetical protein
MPICDLVWLKHVFDADILSEQEREPRRPDDAA